MFEYATLRPKILNLCLKKFEKHEIAAAWKADYKLNQDNPIMLIFEALHEKRSDQSLLY